MGGFAVVLPDSDVRRDRGTAFESCALRQMDSRPWPAHQIQPSGVLDRGVQLAGAARLDRTNLRPTSTPARARDTSGGTGGGHATSTMEKHTSGWVDPE